MDPVGDWHSLGVKLNLQGYQLREIERNYDENNRRKNEVLDLWLRNTRNPSWEPVVQALYEMKEKVLADNIRTKYCCSTAIGNFFTVRFNS